MWIMTNNSYLSIVSKDCGPAELLVRARRAGDIEKVFPNAKVTRQTDTDYLYRAILPRDVVKQALAAMIDLIDYPNFKDSVEDRSLHAAYVSVWCAMAGLQHPPPEIERATHARSALTSKNTRWRLDGLFLDHGLPRPQQLGQFRPQTPARDVAHRDGDGLFLA